jgi:nitrate reductase gamma subunit
MDTALLFWAKGTGLQLATLIMFIGLTVRVAQILALRRPPDYSEAKNNNPGVFGVKTIFRRFLPPQGMMKRNAFVYVTGYIFHIGFFVVLLFFIPHIEMFKDGFGISWPGLRTSFIDAITVITMLTLILVLINRLRHPVQRMLSGFEDYLTWTLTFLPLLTGYMAYHHMALQYELMLAIHILSVEALMVAIPFTRLSHMVTLFFARWYNGVIAGRKGVQS